MKELLALLRELCDKKIITEKCLEEWTFLAPEDEDKVRIGALGWIDAAVDGNDITADQAESYIKRLGIPHERMDDMRTSLREKQEKKKHLN